jgi:hypothetical protein
METNDPVLTTQLEAIKNGQQRARVAFFLSIIAVAILLGALWNEFLAWDRHYVNKPQPATWAKEQSTSALIKNWQDGQFINVSLLGIRFSVDDIQVLGSLTLFILSFYYCLCLRRENHEIAYLLESVKGGAPCVKQMAFQGIRSSMVFLSTSGSDAPIAGLGAVQPPPAAAAGAAPAQGFLGRARLLWKQVIGDPGQPVFFRQRGFIFLTYLPFWAVVAILASDVYYLTLFDRPYRANLDYAWKELTDAEKWQFILHDLFAILLLFPILGFCRRSAGYLRATRQLVVENFPW